MGVTGYVYDNLPEGPERDEAIVMIRLGVKFAAQQNIGKKPGFMACYLTDLATRIKGPLTFESLLLALRIQALTLSVDDESDSPIENVDLSFELLTYHHPRRGRLQMPFGTLRNYLTKVKKDLGR
jgi:hypothetical protein